MLHSGSLQHLLLCHASDWEQAVLSASQLHMLIIETTFKPWLCKNCISTLFPAWVLIVLSPLCKTFGQMDLLEKASARLPYLSQKQSFKGRAVTCHNQVLLRKISHPVSQRVTCFFYFTFESQACCTASLCTGKHPSETCMSFMQLLLLSDLICLWQNLLERIGYLQGDVDEKLEKNCFK